MNSQHFSTQLVAHLLYKLAPDILKPRLPQSTLYGVSVATVTSHLKEEPEIAQVHLTVLEIRSIKHHIGLNQSCRKAVFLLGSLLLPFIDFRKIQCFQAYDLFPHFQVNYQVLLFFSHCYLYGYLLTHPLCL